MTLLQTAPPKMRQTPASPPVPAPPRLVARAGRRSVEMLLTELRIEAEMAGLSAEVTLFLTFNNPHKRELQGELLFTLPDGATVCGYGLDINGELADASLVERHHARRAFEKEVRQVTVIDPGLVEHVRGNVFRTRIYPLPAKGRRQIKLQYVTGLSTSDGGAVLDVPLATTGKLQTLDARVAVMGAPNATLAGGAWADAGFVRADGHLVAQVHRRDVEPEAMRVILPAVPITSAAVELANDGGRYFALHHLIRRDATLREPDGAVRSIRLLWDASLSRALVDLSAEFQVLRRLLARLGDIDVELVTFRHEPEPARTFRVTGGDAGPLIEHLVGLSYDGGTRLEAVADLLRGGDGRAFTLLCSDGIGTLDDDDDILCDEGGWDQVVPVFALTTARQSNHALLRHIAGRTGGTLVDLVAGRGEDAAERIGRQPYALLSVEVIEGDVADLLPAGPQPAEGLVLLTGRLLTPRARLRLSFGYAGMSEAVDSVEVVVDGSTAVAGRVTPRLWAQQQVAALATSGERHAPRMLELGRNFGLVTPGTSLLVLETLWQHLEHEVEPARSRARLYQGYHEALAARSDQFRTPPSEHRPGPAPADLATRTELLRFYARLSIGQDEDVDWLAEQTEGLTAAQIVELIDGAVFLARSSGQAKVGRQALLAAAERFLHRRLAEPDPLRSRWRSRSAWWERGFPPPPAKRVPTVRPDKNRWWGGNSAAFASRTRSFDSNEDATIERTLDRSLDLAGLSSETSGATLGGAATGETLTQAATAAPAWRMADLPSIDRFSDAAVAEQEYLRLRERHVADANFYADWAAAFLARGWRAVGLRILSNLAEVALDDAEHLRTLGYHAEAAGADGLAEAAYSRVLRLRPEEPQAHRDLALVLARRGDVRWGDVRRAAALLEGVVHGRWDSRFGGIQMVALAELNALVARHRRENPSDDLGVPIPSPLAASHDVDLRVVLDWNADATDLDLWVIEPTGELCGQPAPSDGHTSRIGGLVPDDMSGGYGPEEYLLRRAPSGRYRLLVRHAGDGRRRADRTATAKLTVIHDFGRPQERREVHVLRVPFHEPPRIMVDPELWGCAAGVLGFLLLLAGIAARAYWLVAAAILLWAAAYGWTRYANGVAQRHRTERNVVEAAELLLPDRPAAVTQA